MNLFQRYKKYTIVRLFVRFLPGAAVRLGAVILLWAAPFLVIAQNNNVSLFGRVIDEKTKDPLAGAVVHIKGTTHEVIADQNGEFKFITGQRVPVIYVVSYVGYKELEVPVNSYGHAEIQLKGGNSSLNEVVVVGYGTQRKSDITGSVATVSKSLLSRPAASFDNLLQGAVAGVSVSQSSGQPGATSSIRIRGGNSLSFGNDPLYVIDGVPIQSGGTSASGATMGSLGSCSGS